MKNVLLLFVLLSILLPANAENWINTKNLKPPIVYIDKDSIRSYNNGVVFAVRYFSPNKGDIVTMLFADVYTDKVGVIFAKPYSRKIKYKFDTSKMITMNSVEPNNSIYQSYQYVQKQFKKKKFKKYKVR